MPETKLEIKFNPRQFEKQKDKLRAMAVRCHDVSPAWNALLTWFTEQEFEQFLSRGHRFGNGWAPLKQRTKDEKLERGYPLDPLIRTGRLSQSLTHRPLPIEHITPHEVVGGTDVPWARFHQRGTSRMPRRILFDAAQIRREKAATTAVANWILRGEQKVGGRRLLRSAA